MMRLSLSEGFWIISLALWGLMSIAMITVGAMYFDKCLVQPLIPIYLIVAGVIHLLAILLLPLKYLSPQLSGVLEGVLLACMVCWIIAGNVWIFPTYTMHTALCNSVLYRFSFGVLILQYIYLILVSVTMRAQDPQ
ncbi:transmembrane protein 272-like [Pseudophryne corroboree]|uniref:transmembrane protein 272-like n=1 Tax=Pseudophryne corroboree TaxID=495146 RepID=UPI0030813555